MAATGPQAWAFPDAFMGRATLSAYEPYPAVTGFAYSSFLPASGGMVYWHQPQPVVFKYVAMQNSMNAIVASASSQASTGSEAYSYGVTVNIYSRQDYSANSSNLTWVTSGSFGLSASLGYSSTSQQFGLSWVTDSTGGTSNFTTTSNSDGWSNYASGAKAIGLPLVATLTAGEYWMGFQHSSTTNTSNSNITLLSMSQLYANGQQSNNAAGVLGASATTILAGGPNQHAWVFSAGPVTSGTFAPNVHVYGLRANWFAFSQSNA